MITIISILVLIAIVWLLVRSEAKRSAKNKEIIRMSEEPISNIKPIKPGPKTTRKPTLRKGTIK